MLSPNSISSYRIRDTVVTRMFYLVKLCDELTIWKYGNRNLSPLQQTWVSVVWLPSLSWCHGVSNRSSGHCVTGCHILHCCISRDFCSLRPLYYNRCPMVHTCLIPPSWATVTQQQQTVGGLRNAGSCQFTSGVWCGAFLRISFSFYFFSLRLESSLHV